MATQQQDGRVPPRWVLVPNRCDPAWIDGRFLPLVDAAVAACIETLPRVVDVRLQGSVARGEATIGRSDIDVMALVDTAPDGGALARLQDRADGLRRRYPVVSRVDLDAVPRTGLSPFQRLVLSSDSLSVYGKDTLTRRKQRVDRAELTRLVTPDAAALVTDYRTLAEEARAGGDAEETRFCSQLVGKDLLKCLRLLILLDGGEYEVSIDRIYGQVADHIPELSALADRLYWLYREPVIDPDLVIGALDEATSTLLPAIRSAW